VFAPPFQIVDITIQSQDYPFPCTHLLPATLLEKDAKTAPNIPEDVISSEILDEIRKSGAPMEEALDNLIPEYHSRFAPDFNAHLATRGDTQFQYTPTGIVATDASLEQFKAFISKGRTPSQIYDQEIRPRLVEI
jgi:hypothetical protein